MSARPFIPAEPPAVEDYAAIGNCRSIALVSRWGSIDWWCLPHFSGPSVFAALLDARLGGRFALAPTEVLRVEQRYERHTNVLRTLFECPQGVLELLDFMSLPGAEPPAPGAPLVQQVVRVATCLAGRVELAALVEPRPDYARAPVRLEERRPGHWHCLGPDIALDLATSLPLRLHGGDTLAGSAVLQAGDRRAMLLRTPARSQPVAQALEAHAVQLLDETIAWWRRWCECCPYDGADAQAVLRSALMLKLLTHEPSGAVIAAATTSLPEGEDGSRNWDYRYCWLRDTSLVLDAFTDLGHTQESDAFLGWLLHATRRTRPRLHVMYTVDGGTDLPERELTHLSGWRGIGPVRIGNAASQQVQHDVYGQVIFTAWDYVERGGRLEPDEKQLLAEFAEVVCRLWREPDHGIWEIRLPPRHNTHSKLMCWVALDRALLLRQSQGLAIDEHRVRAERDAIRRDIEAHGFDERLGSYVGHYGSDAPDAALLLMPRMGYLAPDHPRMRGTVRYIMDRLMLDSGLMYRYPPGEAYDGVPGREHLFVICSFWCVDCLAREGRLQEAERIYERLLGLSNHVGLYAEEFRQEDGQPMGNFPQAFSHVGLITASMSLARARERRL